MQEEARGLQKGRGKLGGREKVSEGRLTQTRVILQVPDRPCDHPSAGRATGGNVSMQGVQS